MQCPQCRHDNAVGTKYCGECGGRLLTACHSCGTSNSSTRKFCGECGGRLAAGPGAPPPATPVVYTPRHLAEKILTSRAALEGERKQVTVLFADLKGSMELLAERDAEDARRLLDPVLEHMMEAVHRYEGTVNQVMGDGIMALFGAPLAQEDHAVRACYAALRMQETVHRYGDGVFRMHGVPMRIRVGLNSGDVVVRSIGSDLRMDYSAVGPTTHLAARMEQLAEPGTILLTPDTLALAEGFVQVTTRGSVPVKGLATPIEVFVLAGASPVRSRLHAAVSRGLTRFVGRDAEMELLRRSLARAREGQGQVVAIVGEPGVGKSRLVWEFTHSHRTQDWLVLEAASVSYGKATTYFPVIELLRRYFQVEPRDETRRIREKLIGKLLSLDRAMEPTLPVFLSLLDVEVDDPEWSGLDATQRRRRTLESLRRLLLRESQVQPLVLVFEDLHWIDSETQILLDTLVESLPTASILLVVNYRPEYSHRWGGKTYYQQLRLDTLPAERAEELFEALAGPSDSLDTFRHLLIARTEGNPFFLEESVRALVETGVLIGERGAYRLARPVADLQLPATAQAILAARIDRLDTDDKRLLQAAAVIGKDIPLPLLHAVADEPEDDVRERLARLQGAEFLYEARLFPEVEYTFKHALTHEVAYGSLLHDRRRALHSRILATIEAGPSTRLDEHVEALASHAIRAESWMKAVAYLRQAGQKAAARSVHRAAASWFELALEALGHLPDTRETREAGFSLRHELRGSLLAVGEVGRLGPLIDEARALAETLDDPAGLSRTLSAAANFFRISGDALRAVDPSREAVAIAQRLGDRDLENAASYELAMALGTMGRYRESIEIQNGLLATLSQDGLLNRSGPGILTVHTRTWLARNLAAVGDFRDARVRAEEALRIAEAAGYDFSLMHGHLAVGLVHAGQGDGGRAIPPLERSLDIARRGDLGLILPTIVAVLGSAYLLAGRAEDAIALLEGFGESKRGANVSGNALLATCLSEACLLAGRAGEAGQAAAQALDLARRMSQHGNEAWAMRLRGEIHAREEPPDVERARASYVRAMARATELEMRPLVAHCHLGLGRLWARIGERAGAQEHLTTATRMYREMEMRHWSEHAEAALKALP